MNVPSFAAGVAAMAACAVLLGAASSAQTTCAPTAPSFLPATSKLVFCDEFNGTTLGPAWYPNWFDSSGCSILGLGEGSQTVNRAENVYVADGSLHLVTRRENTACYGITQPHTSGLVQTGGHYNTKTHAYDVPPGFTCTVPCYVETSFRTQSPGPWPAIWMLESSPVGHWEPGHEIDILEQWGKNFRTWQSHVHLLCDGVVRDSGKGYRGPDTTSGFHSAGMWWRANRIDFYVDNQPAFTYTGCGIPQPGVRYYLLLNGGVIGILGRAPSVLPWTLMVDYVRVWTT